MAPKRHVTEHSQLLQLLAQQSKKGCKDQELTHRLAPVLKTIFHQCFISYTCSQTNSDGSVLKQSHQS